MSNRLFLFLDIGIMVVVIYVLVTHAKNLLS